MIDPLEQAIDVVRQYWPKEEAAPSGNFSMLDSAKKKALEAQDDRDWAVASVFRYKTLDSPSAFIVLLWRPLGTGDTIAKIQIKPVLVHWNVDIEDFILVELSRLE
jgi:hypothetical protein